MGFPHRRQVTPRKMIGLATASIFDSKGLIDREPGTVAYRDVVRKTGNVGRVGAGSHLSSGRANTRNARFGFDVPILSNKSIANSIARELNASLFCSLEKPGVQLPFFRATRTHVLSTASRESGLLGRFN
jgi:hypothetical protein